MTEPAEPTEERSPAEQAVFEHLAVLREDPPMPGSTLVKQVIKTARWQHALSRPLFVIESLASAIKGGLGLLFAQTRHR